MTPRTTPRPTSRLRLTAVVLGLTALVLRPDACRAEDRPDVLIIMADDATFSDLPIHGGTNVRTPRLERLASEGMQFDRAYVSMAMCTPCRSALYTGLYPARSGVCWNHAPARPGTTSVVHHLGALGYRVGLTGKVHVMPPEVFPFEVVGGFEPNCVAPTAGHDCEEIGRFMARRPDEPFCLVVALVVPHAPWTVGDPDHFDPEALDLPPYLVDTPTTRRDYARYLAEIEVLDRQVGDVLEALERSGRADRTLVLFTSEQGAQFPACKWTNYDQGLHTAMLARWPGRIEPGARTDAIVQYEDVLPTLVEAAGGDPSSLDLDGTSFLPVLLGAEDTHRRFAYAMHNNVPEGPPYPIRSVFDGEYRYIRNLSPSALYIERHLMGRSDHNPYWSTWMFATPDDPHALAMVRRYMSRPAEELYRLADDPFELNDLADDPAHAAARDRLGAELDRWMASQGDPGAAIDTQQQHRSARRGRHFVGAIDGDHP